MKCNNDTMINLADNFYLPNSLVNGDGIRDVIFFQGCGHDCPGCHNPTTHEFTEKKLVSVSDVVSIIKENALMIDGVTLSGGDPLYQHQEMIMLCRSIKESIPSLSIWVYTGFDFKEVKNILEDDLKYIDVIVDGKYIESLKCDEMHKGSSNQKIYYLKNGNVYFTK